MCVVAGAVGAVAGGVGSLVNAVGGGGGGAPSGGGGGVNYVDNLQSLGQNLTGILGGGVAAGLGLSGLEGGNLNQLQAGAAAANPFGQYAGGFVPMLQNLLGSGGILNNASGAWRQEQGALAGLNPNIQTNTEGLSGLGNISTPGVTSALGNMVNNPLSGVQLPDSLKSILGESPYSFTKGEQFQYQTGLDSLQRTQAAQGLTGSGNQAVALEQYGQNFASQATQQNIQNLFGAQNLANQMGQNQFGNALNLGQFLGNQQQATFGNQLGVQQLESSQQQNSFNNASNRLSQILGINNQALNTQAGLLGPLLMATQASSSSPAAAGGILANLGVANQTSAGNLNSGIGGLANGLGNLLGSVGFGGGNNFTGDFSTGGGYTSGGDYNSTLYGPSGYGGGYTYGGDNSYGFTI